MTLPPPLYDLVVLLDPAAEEAARARVIADVERMISTGGELVRHDDWGARALAYQIDHRGDASYHLFQFHPTSELLAQLNRTLRITDEILRFRIIKLKPGTPDAPEMRPVRRPEEAAPAPASAPPAPAAAAAS